MTVITFDHAKEILQAQEKRGFDKKKLANNTYLLKGDKYFAIQLHNTEIVKIHEDDIYELNSGGWQTVTTKARLNEYAPCQILQKRGVWYLGDTVYFDGIRVKKNGEIVNNDSAPDNLIERRKRLDRMISKYIRAFAADVKENGLENPGAGDCLYCQIYLQQPKESQAGEDLLHIYSHLEEEYFVPSLLFRAIKERGYANPAFIWSLIKRDAENGRAETLKQCLRHFFSKRKSQLVNFIEL